MAQQAGRTRTKQTKREETGHNLGGGSAAKASLGRCWLRSPFLLCFAVRCCILLFVPTFQIGDSTFSWQECFGFKSNQHLKTKQ